MMRSVTASELSDLVASGARVIDVRDNHEWRAGRLPFAEHMPLDRLGSRAGEIDRNRLTVFVCRSGLRSGNAAIAFAQAGYEAANLDGGMEALEHAGYEIVDERGRRGMVV